MENGLKEIRKEYNKKCIEILNKYMDEGTLRIEQAISNLDHREREKTDYFYEEPRNTLERWSKEIKNGNDGNYRITKEMLLKNGFTDKTEPWTKEYYETEDGFLDYQCFERTVDDGKKITHVLTMSHYPNNSGEYWTCHVDNGLCETIGHIDLSDKKAFNGLMDIMNINFKLD